MLRQDIRFALRQLFAAPGFSFSVILTLALGIGVNSTVFSLLNGFLLRKLPYPRPENLAALVVHKDGTGLAGEEDDSFDGSEWQTLRQSVGGVRFASWGGSGGFNLQGGNREVGYVRGSRVSAAYFDVLGIPMHLGRSFSDDEDRPHGPPAVVLSDDLWRSVFDGDRQIVGKSILLKGEPHNVVGVLPPGALTPSKADVFTPLQPSTTGECGGNNCGVLVRLNPGVTWQQVNGELGRIHFPSFAEFETRHGHVWIYARPLQRELAGDQHDRVIVLMLAVISILLIACANLAGLALVRISRRTQEVATRLALGASRWAVIRQLWIENLLLALLGAAAAVGLASLLIEALSGFLSPAMIPMGGFSIDYRVLAFTFAISVATSVLFGGLPALQTRQLDLRSSMVGGGRAIAGGSGRVRQWLIGAEVALTVVLLGAAGLMVRTLIHLETQPPGFDPNGVMTAKASLDDARYHHAAEFQAMLSKSIDAMRRSLGTDDVAVGLSVPYERGLNDQFTIMDGAESGRVGGSSLAYVTPRYFATLRITILSGRPFSDADTFSSLPVAIVNQTFAKRFMGDANPLGRHFQTGKTTYQIVGVTRDVAKRPGMGGRAPISTESVFYLPASQTEQSLINVAHIWFQPSWIVRAPQLTQAETQRRMRQAFAEVAPELPFSGFSSMDQILLEQLRQQRLEVLVLATLGGLALLLSAVGIYALISNLVVQRTREIGIRIALGSTAGRAMRDIGLSGAVAMLAGLAVGLALSLIALRVLSSEIYGVRVYDPVTLATIPVLLALVGGAAILLPASRIIRLDPAETLRSE